ncbi:MAG: hypothetical protein ABSB69_13915 [Solirubrobacteraceae bacterium]
MATRASSGAAGPVARRAAASTSTHARASPLQQVSHALLVGLSKGIERYLPLGVGVVVVGIPLIGVAWLAHALLGIPTWAAGLASLTRILIVLLRRA